MIGAQYEVQTRSAGCGVSALHYHEVYRPTSVVRICCSTIKGGFLHAKLGQSLPVDQIRKIFILPTGTHPSCGTTVLVGYVDPGTRATPECSGGRDSVVMPLYYPKVCGLILSSNTYSYENLPPLIMPFTSNSVGERTK
jgi:hypothetical protein